MAADEDHIVALLDRTVDLVRQAVVYPDGSTKGLTTRETQLLSYLARRPQQDVSRDELLEKVWEYRANYATRAVDVAMRRLRAKVEPDPQNPVHLIAVHGVGYRFVPPPDTAIDLEPVTFPAVDAPRSNLRPERSSFIGRGAQLDAIGRLWTDGARVVSLLGPAGVGKTRLATRFASDHLDDWGGGVWVCELSSADDLAGVAAALGLAIGVPMTGDERALVETLGIALEAHGPVLVILDGCDHVVSHAREALGCWLEAAPLARFLVTSRERLRIAGEHAVEVGPLAPDEARDLFIDRARASGATLRDPTAWAIDRIADRLDRLPLAIELAAPRSRVLSLEQLHDRLDQRFKVLTGGRGSDREEALRNAIDWSWGLLSEPQRRALAWCATFAGGFTLDAAEAVLEDPASPWVLDLIEALRDKSLVHAYEPVEQPGAVRFALYQSIRDYAAERLEQRGETDAAQARHAAHYIEVGEQLAEGIDRRGGLDDFRCLAAEVDNLLAVNRRRRADHPLDGIRAVMALSPVLSTRGPYPLYRRLLDEAVEDAEALVARHRIAAHEERLSEVLVKRANVARVTADMAAARADLGRVLQMLQQSGSTIEVQALAGLALVNIDQSRLDEAEAMAGLALGMARGAGFRNLEGMALGMLASFASMRGRPEEAEVKYLEAIEIHDQVGNARRAALDNANLGLLLIEFGRIAEAEHRIITALHIHRMWKNRRRTANSLMGLALLRGRQERFSEALTYAQEALKQFREVGFTRFVAHAIQNVAALRWALGETEAAVPMFHDAIAQFQEVGDRLSEAMGQAYLAAALASIGDVHGAAAAVTRSNTLLKGLFSRQAEGITIVAQGFVDLARARKGLGDVRALNASARQKADDGTSSSILGIQFIANRLRDEISRDPDEAK